MDSINEKKRLPLIPSMSNPETHLELTISYQSNAYNWRTGHNESKGYFLYCNPIQKKSIPDGKGGEVITWSTIVGKGMKMLLAEVSRRSKKAELTALEKSAKVESVLIQAVCAAYNLQLAEVAGNG